MWHSGCTTISQAVSDGEGHGGGRIMGWAIKKFGSQMDEVILSGVGLCMYDSDGILAADNYPPCTSKFLEFVRVLITTGMSLICFG